MALAQGVNMALLEKYCCSGVKHMLSAVRNGSGELLCALGSPFSALVLRSLRSLGSPVSSTREPLTWKKAESGAVSGFLFVREREEIHVVACSALHLYLSVHDLAF